MCFDWLRRRWKVPIIKIVDIAHAAGVSPATVTRVINKSGYVSAESCQRVEKAIKELGYIPNKMAQNLKNRKSNLIGNMVPLSDSNTIFALISEAVDKAADKKNYNVLQLISQNSPQKELRHLNEMIGSMVEGIIYTADSLLDDAAIRRVAKMDIPIVMIERGRHIPCVDQVLVDNLQGSYMAAAHMLEKGHRRIGFVGSAADHPVERDRFGGYRDALEAAGIPLDGGIVKRMPDYSFSYGYEAVKEIMERETPPTAIFVASDLFAAGALQYFYVRGLRVPDDISIVGYDNTLSQHLAPPVTSVAFPLDEIGDTAIKLLEERNREGRKIAKTVTLSPIFIDRGSVKDILQNASAHRE